MNRKRKVRERWGLKPKTESNGAYAHIFLDDLNTDVNGAFGLSTGVKMSGGKAVNMAAETLMENGLKPIVVTYGSPMYHLLIWRACAGVIWIGHGDKSGVFLGGEKLSWEEFAG